MTEYIEIIDYVTEPELDAIQVLNSIISDNPGHDFEVIQIYEDSELRRRIFVKITWDNNNGG